MAGVGEWKNGLCGCFGDCGLCILTYFLPCVTAGQNAEKVGKSCCLYGFLTLLGCIGIYTRAIVRTQIRETNGIQNAYVCGTQGSFCQDCCLHWFCALCALVQEAQEMKGATAAGDPEQQEIARE